MTSVLKRDILQRAWPVVAMICLMAFPMRSVADTIYVDVVNGNDANPGTSELPLKSLLQAALLVNTGQSEGSATIKIRSGLYVLDSKVTFDSTRVYTEGDRLTIEAEILPDDSAWAPELMPIIISTASPSVNFGFDCIVGLDIGVSHATVRGLKFLGNPTPNSYYYPIGRQSTQLDDLVVTQCLFVGSEDALPIQSGVLAHGHGIAVDHCVFYNCRNAVVYYFVNIEDRTALRHGSSMTYCIVYGSYESGIWFSSPDDGFQFDHNIFTRCQWALVHNHQNTARYTLSNSILTGNKNLLGAFLATYEIGPSDFAYRYRNVIDEGDIVLDKKTDVTMPATYLEIAAGTLGSSLGAGLHIGK